MYLRRLLVYLFIKKGETSSVANYRPVSLLPLFSKIIEKSMARRLVDFLDRFSLLSDDQYRLRRGLSTADTLVNYIDHLYGCLDRGEHVISVFVDFSRAFDTVKHDILLSKMEMYGIRGKSNEWFKSYLSGRSQQVRVNTSISDKSRIINGLPQGSVLGSSFISNICK